MNTPTSGRKAKPTGQFQLAQDFNRIFLESIEKIVHPPENEHSLYHYYEVADKWWCTMIESCADYPKNPATLCFRAEVVILELAKYMWQHVQPDWKGTSDRLRFCLFIKLFVDFVRPHVWGQAIFSMWNPEQLECSGRTLLERNCTNLSRRLVQRHAESFESLLEDMKGVVNWTLDGTDFAKQDDGSKSIADWSEDDEEEST